MAKVTEEQKKEIVDFYVESKNAGEKYEGLDHIVKTLSEDYNVSVPVIRGLLVSAGVYVRKEVATKVANTSGTKVEYADAFRAVTGKKLSSVENMSKADLIDLWNWHVEQWCTAVAEVNNNG